MPGLRRRQRPSLLHGRAQSFDSRYALMTTAPACPRLRAFLRAADDAPYRADEARDIRFWLPDGSGRERWLRLDEIPLPHTVLAAWPRW